MVRKALGTMALMVLAIPVLAWPHAWTGNAVDVRVVSDSGSEFAQHRAYLQGSPGGARGGRYSYVEAVKGERYSIQVINRSSRRIGVVIAVDGRNIISGKKSDLERSDRMYIIGPYETNTFEGWRTGMDRTNRFYFTQPSDSYAEKVFSDASAMGTIALAVYGEKVPDVAPHSGTPPRMKESPGGASAPAPGKAGSADGAELKKDEQAGTGFGETTYSPAYVVQFDPEQAPDEKIVLKYEWRSTLCNKGIIPCGPKNRFWPEDHEFAPIPKDFRG